MSKGAMESAAQLQTVGAGLLLGVTLIGWYIFLALILSAVDFPYNVPLGDLSTIVKGASEKRKSQRNRGPEAGPKSA